MATKKDKTPIKRDPAATKERLLRAGIAEFGTKGVGGARAATIAKRAKCNIRMLYHYFGGKENLYQACLERVYSKIRMEERLLNLHLFEPQEAIERLVQFTFEHMLKNPDFVRMAGVENTQRGKYIKKLPLVANAASELNYTISDILERGARAKLFRDRLDPFQIYLSILSMSYMHLSNRYTISITYGRDVTDEEWLKLRHQHVMDMVLAYIKR